MDRGASGITLSTRFWHSLGGAIDGCFSEINDIRSLTYGLEQDGKSILPGAAVQVAKRSVLKIARADLWWIRNRSDWLRDGGAAVTSRATTKAAWAAKWKGLARLAPAETDGLAATRGGALE